MVSALADAGLPRAGTGDLRTLTGQVLQVWQRLPEASGVRLAQLAAAALGDAHALDYRRPLGRAVSRLVAVAHGLPKPLRSGRDWRRAWAAVGIRCDGVSSRVLTLNLPLSGRAPAARWSAATPGEPVWLSLRSITGVHAADPTATFHVCENPTVLEAAADELGPRCPPLICTDGTPSTAAIDLIAGLARTVRTLRVRADIDEAGFVVVEQVRAVAPAATTWRFDPTTYLRHLGLPDTGDLGDSDVDGDEESRLRRLQELYARHQVALHEEALLDQLLEDLREAQSPGT